MASTISFILFWKSTIIIKSEITRHNYKYSAYLVFCLCFCFVLFFSFLLRFCELRINQTVRTSQIYFAVICSSFEKNRSKTKAKQIKTVQELEDYSANENCLKIFIDIFHLPLFNISVYCSTMMKLGLLLEKSLNIKFYYLKRNHDNAQHAKLSFVENFPLHICFLSRLSQGYNSIRFSKHPKIDLVKY